MLINHYISKLYIIQRIQTNKKYHWIFQPHAILIQFIFIISVLNKPSFSVVYIKKKEKSSVYTIFE